MDNKVIINAHEYEVVDLYTPNHEYIGEIKNPNELYDVRIQIFLQGVDDYYLVRNAETGEKEVIYFNKFGNLCGGNLYDEDDQKLETLLINQANRSR